MWKWVPSASRCGSSQKERSEITLRSKDKWPPAHDSVSLPPWHHYKLTSSWHKQAHGACWGSNRHLSPWWWEWPLPSGMAWSPSYYRCRRVQAHAFSRSPKYKLCPSLPWFGTRSRAHSLTLCTVGSKTPNVNGCHPLHDFPGAPIWRGPINGFDLQRESGRGPGWPHGPSVHRVYLLHSINHEPPTGLSFAPCFGIEFSNLLQDRLILIPRVLEICLHGNRLVPFTLRTWLAIGRRGWFFGGFLHLHLGLLLSLIIRQYLCY